jgi:2-iminobutanoate/2-iminopropanoate deaminase
MKKLPIGGKITLPNGAKAQFSKAYRANDMLFMSGTLPFDNTGKISSGDIELQTTLCLQQLEILLRDQGLDKTNIVKLGIWLTCIDDFNGFNKSYAAFFGDHKPARSTVRSDLMIPGARVEIEAIAVY